MNKSNQSSGSFKGSRTSVESTPRGQEGFALLLAVVVAVLLSLIGLSLTSTSLTEFTMSSEFEAHENALLIADAGLNLVKNDLRGQNLTTVLSTPSVVPRYLESSHAGGAFSIRNPLLLFEARNINFGNPPEPIGTRSVYGQRTPTTGTPMGQGRYFALVSDNQDEPLGLPNNPRIDTDYTVLVRVLGLHRGLPEEMAGSGSATKNAIALMEATLKRDLSFNIASPLVSYGRNVNASFSGNSFDLIGDGQHAAVSVLNDDPGNGDANLAYQSMLAALGKKGKVTGLVGPDGISVVDGTNDIRTSDNPDAKNIFSPYFLTSIVNLLATVADNLFADDITLSGSGVSLGTVDSPQVTVAMGDFRVSGSGNGAGILVVKGAFEVGGAFDFDGVVLVMGEGAIDLHGANKDIRGGLYVANIEDDGEGDLSFGTTTIDVSGNSNFIFDSDNIQLAISLLPLKVISQREITPEIEP